MRKDGKCLESRYSIRCYTDVLGRGIWIVETLHDVRAFAIVQQRHDTMGAPIRHPQSEPLVVAGLSWADLKMICSRKHKRRLKQAMDMQKGTSCTLQLRERSPKGKMI